MRSSATTLHPGLSRVISETGHTDVIVVSDAGLPIPVGSERIDLAFRPGMPSFIDVLDTVLGELAVEGATATSEMAEQNPEVFALLSSRLAAIGVELELVPHVTFKERMRPARAFVRSGEFSPYANVILHAGVPY
ncbi:MAG: D-ribose pyranase [Microbacterium sp. SCN 70-200]|uniref:D-ribose pyranase n=1 Tax=unclassified Microbacterium TaxID=2609290 RepID=UPI00086CF3A9|nr:MULTISPECIES: D-ribose pyranase [unclassified Microbacterium]MBN9214931.1 D-ribose pyranase [Microbacterium sp.]ODT42969.1 MAG: D-ribose pyranase [Microbacterium sp. SCN 70-200]OJV84725.1 MAG: D-ribose pyranase [Microbacterium sp. 70-16]